MLNVNNETDRIDYVYTNTKSKFGYFIVIIDFSEDLDFQ